MGIKQVCWDTETSGVDVETDRILTCFISIRDGDQVVKERDWILNPGIEIPEEATAIHGYTTSWVMKHGRKDVSTAIDEIVVELSEASRSGYVITGYNNSFDLSILENEAKRHMPGVQELAFKETARFVDPIIIDRAIDKYRKGSRKLKDVARHYGVVFSEESLHDAGEDVRVTAQLVPRVLNAAYRVVPDLSGLTPDEMINWLQGFQREKKREWASHLTEYFARTGKVEDDGQPIIVNGAFPW